MPDAPPSPSSVGASNPTHPMGNSPQEGQAKDLVNRMTETAHGAVDRLAEKAGPAVQKLESGVTQVNEALHEQAHRMREMGDEWTHSLRNTIRENPLSAVLLAMAAGALISRISRDHHHR
jgi:ElaB/YqjD/DUF883 family membrane-anchored ribosome-binding protein